MAIRNVSRKTKIALKHRELKTIPSHAKGLMFTKKIKNLGLVFVFQKEKKISLHMLFVFYPIDILWLDEYKKVADLKENAKPFVLQIKPRKNAKYVMELPAGAIKKSRTKEGDKIEWG